jgi:tetratricopeptide (TPR) repeat protein
VRIWDSATGKELLALKGHAGWVTSVAFSPDGQRLASANQDGSVDLWETASVSREVQHRRATNQMVADLFGQMPLRADVLERLRILPGMSPSRRQEVLAVAQTYPENPNELNKLAWELVKPPCGEMSDYRKALRYSEEACQLEPENGDFQSTLGVADYRVGNYEKALDVVARSDKIHALKDEGSNPAELAFLAMAHQQLGHAKEAEAKLQLLRERMKDPRWAQDAQAQGFCAKRKRCWQSPGLPAASKPVRAARGRVRSLASGIRWDPSGFRKVTPDELIVCFERRSHNPILREAALDRDRAAIPWLGGRRIRFAFN